VRTRQQTQGRGAHRRYDAVRMPDSGANRLADTTRNDKQLKRTAALLASRPGVVDHVRRTGRLRAEIPFGGAHIGARLLVDQRGWDIELREDEQLVYDALVRDRNQSPTKQRMESSKKRGADPLSRDLIYGEAPNGGLVFMERSRAFENIAFRAAVTWGDFRKGAPTLYDRALARLGYRRKSTSRHPRAGP
jgi:hypothetical protein